MDEAGRDQAARQRVASVFAFLAGAIGLIVLLRSFGSPLTDLHGFRQTQTAISAWWMLHGGPWLDYWTPVLGAPWAIPFEFPLYQGLVAALVRLTGWPLDDAGRLVSYLWLIVGLWPAAVLIRSYGLPRATVPIYAMLLLASPIYLFWGRAFLIETEALTLSIGFLALFNRWLVARCWWVIPLAGLSLAAAALTKITTILPFVLLAFAMMVRALWTARHRLRECGALCLGSALAVIPPLLVFAIWNGHADRLRALHPIAAQYGSTTPFMIAWNFGTWQQRTSLPFALTIARAMIDVVGSSAPILLLMLAGTTLWFRRRHPAALWLSVVLLAAWAVPFGVLTNLHIQHNYYQASNAALLAGAVAIAIGTLALHLRPVVLALLLSATLCSQLGRFYYAFLPPVGGGADLPRYRLGLALRKVTAPDSALVGFGLDWSAVTPYYAERKALLLSPQMVRDYPGIAFHATEHLGSAPLGAIVDCSTEGADPAQSSIVQHLTRGLRTISLEDCLVFLPRPRAG